MPLLIDNVALTGDMNEYFTGKKKALSGVRLTREVLEEACPIIEKRLSDNRYLRQFQWAGKQAFYNDEPMGKKEVRNVGGDHLVNQFHAEPETSAGGYGAIHLSNPKEVRSRRGTWNLFDELMWVGWGAYQIPDKPVPMESGANRLPSYRKNKELLVEPLNYYYRYQSKWFYNATKRGGFTDSLHSKFQQYIIGAISYGIESAIQNIVDRGEGTEEMKSTLEEVR